MTYNDGSYYSGGWLNGRYDQYGQLCLIDGQGSYEGTFSLRWIFEYIEAGSTSSFEALPLQRDNIYITIALFCFIFVIPYRSF